MCTADAVQVSGGAFGSASEALRMAGAALDYLNSPVIADLDGSACGELLIGLGEIQAKLAAGDITDSLAFTIADWTRKLPAGMRDETDRILLDAAAAGASLDDLATIAACAIERWHQQQPDPDNPDDR